MNIFQKLNERARLNKKIKKVDELIGLRENSLRKHSKGSIREYNNSGIPTLKMNREILIQLRDGIFRKKESPTLKRDGDLVAQVSDVLVATKRKTRSDKGKKRARKPKKK